MKKVLLIGMALFSIFLLGCEGVDLSKVGTEDINKVIQCNKPYIRFGTSCCLDSNSNGVCDNDEVKKEDTSLKCEKPYLKFGSSCCLDKDDNKICDKDEKPVCKDVQVPYEGTETYTDYEKYTEKVPYQEEECQTVQVPQEVEHAQEYLYDVKDKKISASGRLTKALSLKADDEVEISFQSDDTLNLWVFDDDEYEKIVENYLYQSDQYYVKKTSVTSASVTFRAPKSDNYVVYLKNPHVFSDVKVFEMQILTGQLPPSIEYYPEEQCDTVTKYKDEERTRPVEKTRTVTKYRTEQKCS